VIELIAHARADWPVVIRGLARAGAALAVPAAPAAAAAAAAKATAMAQRMVARWAADGAAGLAWLDAGGELPVSLAGVARAFADDDDRGPVAVALFLEAARRAAEVADQLGLAAPLAPQAAAGSRRLHAALRRAYVREFRPRRRRDADFDRVRAVGYVAAAPAGRVVEVRVPGLAWRGHVLRKADVIVSERAEIVGATS